MRVIHKTLGVCAEDYLVDCVYGAFDEFMDHIACARENRRLAAAGERGRCGSYFAGMVRYAIREARRHIVGLSIPYVRQSGL